MTEEELKHRTKQFGLRCIRLAESLPNKPVAKAIANQLVRCGTSVGANYRAACRGRSKAEFIAKLGNVEEEADESAYWMEMIVDAGLAKKHLIPLHQEAEELVRIIVSSIRSSRFSAVSNPKSNVQNPK